jgi:O-antigen/teichoic acid export membrane protein
MASSAFEAESARPSAGRVRQVAFGYTWTLGSRMLSLAVGALAAVLIPRWLGPADYGNYAWVISVASFFLIFADFGISSSTARYVAQYEARQPEAVPLIVRDGLQLQVVFGLTFALVNWIGAPWLAEQFASHTLVWPLRLASLYVLVMSVRELVAMALQALQRLDLMAGVFLAGSVVKALLSVVLVYLGLGIGGAVVGQVAGQGLALALGAVLLYRLLRSRKWPDGPRPLFSRQLFSYGLPIMLTGISFYIYSQGDTFLLRYLQDATQVGYYAMPLQLVVLMAFPAGALGTTVAPMLAELQEKDQNPGTLLLESIRFTLILFVPLATFLLVLARPFISLLYGESYLPSVPVFQIYMPFFAFFALGSVLSVSMNFLGLANQRAKVVVAAAFLKVLLVIAVIPVAGIVGTAFVALVTYAGIVVTYLGIVVRNCQVEPRALANLSWRIMIPAVAVAGLAALLRGFANSLVGLGLVGLASALVFGLLLLALGGIDRRDWHRLRLILVQKREKEKA